jgi:hypothetical protein
LQTVVPPPQLTGDAHTANEQSPPPASAAAPQWSVQTAFAAQSRLHVTAVSLEQSSSQVPSVQDMSTPVAPCALTVHTSTPVQASVMSTAPVASMAHVASALQPTTASTVPDASMSQSAKFWHVAVTALWPDASNTH